jgi:hypothetical protein
VTLYGEVALAQLQLRGGPGSGPELGHPFRGGHFDGTVNTIEKGLAAAGDNAPSGIATGTISVEINGDLTADDVTAFVDDNADEWDAEPDLHLAVIEGQGKTTLAAVKLYQAKAS